MACDPGYTCSSQHECSCLGGDARCGLESSQEWADWPLPANHPTEYAMDAATVLDSITGLRWQRETPAGSYTWADATTYCANLNVGGLAGWRLPTLAQLMSLVDFSVSLPSINPDAFPNTPPELFWTSSASQYEYSGPSGAAWTVFFYGSTTRQNYPTSGTQRVRCVQTPPVSTPAWEPRYAISVDTVIDRRTHLTWRRSASPTALSQTQARAYCNGVWRLPQARELQSLVDVRHSNPALDPTAFPSAPNEVFLTATPCMYANYTLAVSLGYGDVECLDVTPGSSYENLYVRCVH